MEFGIQKSSDLFSLMTALMMPQYEIMRMLRATRNHLPIWFQHHGALSHYATVVMNWLNDQFQDH